MWSYVDCEACNDGTIKSIGSTMCQTCPSGIESMVCTVCKTTTALSMMAEGGVVHRYSNSAGHTVCNGICKRCSPELRPLDDTAICSACDKPADKLYTSVMLLNGQSLTTYAYFCSSTCLRRVHRNMSKRRDDSEQTS